MWADSGPDESFELPVKRILLKHYGQLMKCLYAEHSPLSLPRNFVQVGAGMMPSIYSGLMQLISVVDNRPRVILNDLRYGDDRVKLLALMELVRYWKRVGNLPEEVDSLVLLSEMLLRNQANIATYESVLGLWKEMLKQYLWDYIEFNQQPARTFTPNNEIGEYNLALVSIANYISVRELTVLLNDKRIKSVLFLNGADVVPNGCEGVSYIHTERISSTLQALEFIQKLGFMPVLTIASEYTQSSLSPILGGLYIKPGNESEASFLSINHQSILVTDPTGFSWDEKKEFSIAGKGLLEI